jgi:uncharacterized protein (TIGR00251 family)
LEGLQLKFAVVVKPNSHKTQIKSYDEKINTFYVDIKSPPQDGKANLELEKIFTKHFSKKTVIKTGHSSKKKILETSD